MRKEVIELRDILKHNLALTIERIPIQEQQLRLLAELISDVEDLTVEEC